MSRLLRFRRFAAILFIVAYLLLTAFYLGRHAIGDAQGGPFGYFWTWDMFPNYPTESVHRYAIGETAAGEWVMLAPNGSHRFRWGVDGDATRLDIDRRHVFFRRAAMEAIGRYDAQAEGDRIQHVYLAETYRPQKYNLPEDLYRDFYHDDVTQETYWATSDGVSPRSVYWRILEEAEVAPDGTVPDWEPSP